MSVRALQVNAIVGLASAMLATSAMWLVLTRPADVAYAVANREYGAVAAAVGHQLLVWVHAVVRFL